MEVPELCMGRVAGCSLFTEGCLGVPRSLGRAANRNGRSADDADRSV